VAPAPFPIATRVCVRFKVSLTLKSPLILALPDTSSVAVGVAVFTPTRPVVVSAVAVTETAVMREAPNTSNAEGNVIVTDPLPLLFTVADVKLPVMLNEPPPPPPNQVLVPLMVPPDPPPL
jgi:hypothetical protein